MKALIDYVSRISYGEDKQQRFEQINTLQDIIKLIIKEGICSVVITFPVSCPEKGEELEILIVDDKIS